MMNPWTFFWLGIATLVFAIAQTMVQLEQKRREKAAAALAAAEAFAAAAPPVETKFYKVRGRRAPRAPAEDA